MTQRLDDDERLFAVNQLAYHGVSQLHGTAYALYLSTLFAGIYGTTLSSGAFEAVKGNAVAHDRLNTWGLPGLLLLVVLALVGTFFAGRLRGPVLPDLSLIDLVVTADVDRARLLRPWWQSTALVTVTATMLVGLAVGAGMSVAGLSGALAPIAGGAGGLVVGYLTVHLWLRGQALAGEGAPGIGSVLRVRDALGALRQPALREQAILTQTISTAVYIGGLGHLRREVHLTTPRLRRRRVAVGGVHGTVISADLLALVRYPFATLLGIVLVLLGTPAVLWAMAQHGRPALFLGLALLVVGAGVTRLVRGLRSQADGAGSPPLLGLSSDREMVLHLLPPLLPLLIGWGIGAPVVGLDVGQSVSALLALAMVIAGAQLLVAYRGEAPGALMTMGQSGAGLLMAWFFLPQILLLVVGLAAGGVAAAGGQPQLLMLIGAGIVLASGMGVMRSRLAPER